MTDAPAPPQQQRRSQAQRREAACAALVAAAGDLIVATGVPSLTLMAVGERAGYSRGIVTHHFGSKRALVDAVARQAQDGLTAELAGLPPGLERLLRLVEEHLAPLAGAGDRWAAFLLLWAAAPTSPDLADVMRERDDHVRGHVVEDLTAGQADGTIHAELDPTVTAVALVADLRGTGLQRLLTPSAADWAAVRRAAVRRWRAALAA